MNEKILLGRGRYFVQIPRKEWEGHLAQAPQHSETRLSFMSSEHHLVRYFVVRELPRIGAPIPPEMIAQELSLPLGRTQEILDELEQKLFFLVRNEHGAVCWAYPVTVDPTPHRLQFSSGEQLYAA
jgi:hypothetical protein